MTIEEKITHEREVAAIQRNNNKLNKTLGVISPYYKTDCIKCAEEHEQLADWLEELSRRRVEELFRKTNEKAIRDKAIDDFQEWIKTQIVGLDNTAKKILVAEDDRWESATDKFKERVSND